MSYLLWSLLASLSAVTMETTMRMTGRYYWWFIPLAILVNIGVFKLVTSKSVDTLVFAFLIFSLMNLFLRVGATRFVLQESIPVGMWVAIFFMSMATLSKVMIR